MDIATLKIDDNHDVKITLPNGEETDIVITVCGQDSDTYKAISRKQQNARLKDMQRGRKSAATAETLEERGLELLVACVTGWAGIQDGDKDLECNAENVKMVFEKLPFVKEQIDVAIGDRANFMKS